MQSRGVLSGIKVIDLSRLLPGPYCSMILADHGARVIAIEDERFRAENFFLSTVYRNKEHLSLNLKSDKGREIFFRLVQDADVVLEGFRPGVVDRLGVGYAQVKEVKQDIIYCSITGYGQTGPARDLAGHDVNYLSESGVLDIIGEPDRPPSIPGIQLGDLVGGGMNAALGIVMALLHRERTGEGQYIDISMTDGLVGLLPLVMFFRQMTGKPPERGNDLLSHRFACYNTYETADGRYFSVGAVEARFWKKLCEHLGHPEFIGRQYQEEGREEVIAVFRQIFKTKTQAEWAEELAKVDCCCAPIKNLDEVVCSELFAQREMIVQFPDPAGNQVPTLGVPIKLEKTPGSLRQAPAKFGGHTRLILHELGYSLPEIEELADKGVIFCSEKT